jgi:hypothetical protein
MDDFIIFNKKNSNGSKKDVDPTVVFSPKGLVTLNEPLRECLALTEESKVIFLKKKETKDWYIAKSDDKDAFNLRHFKSGKGAGFNSSHLTSSIYKDIEGMKKANRELVNLEKAIRFTVNEGEIEVEKVKCHLIIISSLRQ